MQVCGRSSNKYDVFFGTAIREMKDRNASIESLTALIGTYVATIQDDVFKPAFAAFSSSDRNGWDYATESPSRKKARLQSDSGAELRLKWSIETKKGIVSHSYGRAFSLYQITIWRSIKLFRYDYHN